MKKLVMGKEFTGIVGKESCRTKNLVEGVKYNENRNR